MQSNLSSANFEPSALPRYIEFNDPTGLCVDAYAKRFKVSQTIDSFRKLIPHHRREETETGFVFQYNDAVAKMFNSEIPKYLDPNRTKLEGEEYSYYKTTMREFPHRATLKWRGETPKASILVQPLSKMDETTNRGAAVVIISQLIMNGILKYVENDGTSGNLKYLELEDGWDKRTMMFVGDGLTMARFKTFDDLINNSAMNFAMRHEKKIMFRKALSRVVVVTGDLHGCFYALMAVYSLFYAAIIQPIQTLLKWKRIVGSDITKCYQQAAGLALMVSDEIQRHLVSYCIAQLENNKPVLDQIKKVKNNPKEVAVILAKHYLEWIELQRKDTSDEVYKMILNYVTMMNIYKNMLMAVQSRDAIMIEWSPTSI